MSIWTSKRPLAAIGLCLALLAGCDPIVGSGPIRVQPVLGGVVRVAGPAGYCIEPGAVLERAGSAIVLIGRCDKGEQSQIAPAILTVAVGEAGSGLPVASSGTELAAFFASDGGRAALSRSGRARTVRVLEAAAVQDAFLIRLTDTSPNRDGPGQPESWRAVVTLGERLVTLSVTGTVQAPLDRNAGRALIDRFVAAMQAANR